jgi:phosphoribosylpyrophosphate synthetase
MKRKTHFLVPIAPTIRRSPSPSMCTPGLAAHYFKGGTRTVHVYGKNLVSAQVAGKHVVIYDDMIRTGGSLKSAAMAYRDAGATAIDAIATHGLFQGDALDKLRASGLFGAIVTTDSHPRSIALAGGGFLQVESTAGLLVEHLNAHRSAESAA